MLRTPTMMLVLAAIAATSTPLAAQAPGRPAWAKAGVRMIYYAAAASIPGSRAQLVLNPDGSITIDGKKYSESNIPGASGHGFTEVTVAHVDERVAVLDIRSLGMNPANNNSRSILTYGAFIGEPSAADFWIHPARLAALRSNPGAGLGVVPTPYPLNGRTYNAVRIVTGQSSSVYDRESGVLLFSTSAATGSPVMVHNPGAAPGVGPGSTVVAQSRLLAVRQTSFPWINAPLPQWFAQTRAIDIQGRVTTEVPGAGTVALPMGGRIEFGGGGANWRAFRITTQLTQTGGVPQMPNTVDRASGHGSFGALALNPQALAGLVAGRALDQDQATGMRAFVVSNDGQAVVIAEQGAGLSVHYQYSVQSGMLLRAQVATTLATGREIIDYVLGNPR
jgi:hypothetical protein